MAILRIKVIPGASKNEILGTWQDMLKVKVTAQPEDGKANKACIELISEKFGIPRNKIRLLKGRTSREKLIEIPEAVILSEAKRNEESSRFKIVQRDSSLRSE